MTAPTPVKREMAHRLFAAEFNASRHQIPGGGEKEPSYLVSPLGAKVNRLHVVGVCTEVESVGKTGEMWRARVSDPTGVFTVMAGSYQPEAMQAMSQLTVPCFVAITGKARTYEPEPGSLFASIRPESVVVADEATRNQWVLDTARRTLERLEATELARAPQATPEGVMAKGVGRAAAEGAFVALAPYSLTDLAPFKEMAKKSLGYLLPGGVMPVHEEKAVEVPTWTPPPAAVSTTAAEDALDAAVLAAVQRLQGARGARWDEVVAACQGTGT
ncbi:MAG: RPA family protein, partial [Thermoplasmatota archaeon]